MKKLILFLLVTLAFSACKKETDAIKPNSPAATIAGTYTLSELKYQDADGTQIIPQLPVVEKGKTTYAGTVELSEATDPNQVNFSLDLLYAGQPESLELEDVDVQGSGSKYTLLVDSEKIATISGNTLSFDVSTDDFRLAFTAKK